MKRRAAGMGILGLILTGCGLGRTDQGESAVSPDGRRTAWAEVNQSQADIRKYLCVKLKITDASGKVEFEQQTGASVTMRWSIAWDGNDKLILRSSDIGNQAWARDETGHWNPAPADHLRP